MVDATFGGVLMSKTYKANYKFLEELAFTTTNKLQIDPCQEEWWGATSWPHQPFNCTNGNNIIQPIR